MSPSITKPKFRLISSAAKRKKEVNHSFNSSRNERPLGPTIPEPFELQGTLITERKKQNLVERINKMLEEEKSKREFHAKPILGRNHVC
jgi:hypothetical protein